MIVCYFWQVLPILLHDSLGKILSGVVEFVMPSNRTWSIRYERERSSFTFLKDFTTFYNIEENFILTFEYLENSSFLVRIFDQSSLEISYFKLCKISKRRDIFWRSQCQFGFAKGNLIDVFRFKNIKGNDLCILKYLLGFFFVLDLLTFVLVSSLSDIVKDYVDMLEKMCDGSSLVSLWNGRHGCGGFVLVLGYSSTDQKLHNVVGIVVSYIFLVYYFYLMYNDHPHVFNI